MEIEVLIEKHKRKIIYILGIGATLMAPLLWIFSPLILIPLVAWVLYATRYDSMISYLFNTTFTSFLIGLCVIKVLGENKKLSLITGYVVSLISAFVPSVFSLNYIWAGHMTVLVKTTYHRIITDRIDIIWLNNYVKIALLISLISMLTLTVKLKKRDYFFIYSVAFLIVLAGVWLHINTFPEAGLTQLSLLEGT